MEDKRTGFLQRLKKFVYSVEISEKKKTMKPSSQYDCHKRHFTPSGESGMSESSETRRDYKTFYISGVPILSAHLGTVRETLEVIPGWGNDGPVPSRDRDIHTKQKFPGVDDGVKVDKLEVITVIKKGKILGIPFTRFGVNIEVPKVARELLAQNPSNPSNWEAYGRIKGNKIYLAGRRAYDAVMNQSSTEEADLASRVSSVIAITGLLGGIFFLSANLTGNAIAELTTKTTSFLGAGLLIIGLVTGFFWLKSRKSN